MMANTYDEGRASARFDLERGALDRYSADQLRVVALDLSALHGDDQVSSRAWIRGRAAELLAIADERDR